MVESDDKMQSMLNELSNRCYKWRLKVNESKSKIVHFRKTTQPRTDAQFKYGDSVLEKVPSYKYLGVLMDEHLKLMPVLKLLPILEAEHLGQS